MYVWGSLWAPLALYGALAWWQTRRWRWLLLYVFAAAAGLWTLYLFVAVLVVANLAFLVYWQRVRRPVPLLAGWAGAQLAVLALFAPWLAYALPRMMSWSSAEAYSPAFFARLYATGAGHGRRGAHRTVAHPRAGRVRAAARGGRGAAETAEVAAAGRRADPVNARRRAARGPGVRPDRAAGPAVLRAPARAALLPAAGIHVLRAARMGHRRAAAPVDGRGVRRGGPGRRRSPWPACWRCCRAGSRQTSMSRWSKRSGRTSIPATGCCCTQTKTGRCSPRATPANGRRCPPGWT